MHPANCCWCLIKQRYDPTSWSSTFETSLLLILPLWVNTGVYLVKSMFTVLSALILVIDHPWWSLEFHYQKKLRISLLCLHVNESRWKPFASSQIAFNTFVSSSYYSTLFSLYIQWSIPMRVGMEAQNEISSSRVCDFRLTMLTLQQPMLILLCTTHNSTALP